MFFSDLTSPWYDSCLLWCFQLLQKGKGKVKIIKPHNSQCNQLMLPHTHKALGCKMTGLSVGQQPQN